MSRQVIHVVVVLLLLHESSLQVVSTTEALIPQTNRRGGEQSRRRYRLHPSSALLSWRRPKTLRSSTSFSFSSSSSTSSSAANASPTTPNDNEENDLLPTQRGMNLALATSYFAVMGAKCALPTVLPLLLDPTTGLLFHHSLQYSRQDCMSRLLTTATMAVALGKIVLGPVIDKWGGIRSLQVALATLTGLLTFLSLNSTFLGFAVAWVFVDFIFSACWASCINAIYQSFPPQQWATRIGTLAASARMGNAMAFASFAAVLQLLVTTGQTKIRQHWRPIFAISAVVQVIPLLLLRYYGQRIPQQQQPVPVNGDGRRKTNSPVGGTIPPPSLGQSLVALRQEAKTPEFWMHLISRSALMVFASFLLFVPTLMSQVYSASAAFGAQTGSLYALGCLLAVTVLSQPYSQRNYHGKVSILVGLLGTAAVSSLAQLLHVSGILHLSTTASAALLFVWGLAFAIPFYIPPSLYALARGGVQSSATIADVFDVGGFSLLAAFNGYVAGITHSNPSAWIPTFQLTTACAGISLVTVSTAVYLEGLKKKKSK